MSTCGSEISLKVPTQFATASNTHSCCQAVWPPSWLPASCHCCGGCCCCKSTGQFRCSCSCCSCGGCCVASWTSACRAAAPAGCSVAVTTRHCRLWCWHSGWLAARWPALLGSTGSMRRTRVCRTRCWCRPAASARASQKASTCKQRHVSCKQHRMACKQHYIIT